jgi:hypothetical protein
MNVIHSINLPLELTNGNDGRGNKWFRSSKVRDDIEWMLRAFGQVRKPFDHPVMIRITRVLGKGQRLWDSDSIGRGNSKELIDALVAVGWFVDDCPKHIIETQFRQTIPKTRGLPSVIVEVMTNEQGERQ